MKKTAILLAAFLMSPVLTANQRTLSDVIREHLSYLGYTSTRDGNTISAKHHIKPGFDILVVSNGILFRAWFAHKKMDDARLGEYVAVVNRLNESTTIGKFYVDRDHDLIVEGWYPLPYSKKSFSNFISTWEHDFAQVLQKNSDRLKDFLS